MGEEIGLIVVMPSMFFLIGWGIWVGSQNGVRKAKIKAVSELQHKLLDKFATAGDLGQFLSSETGRRFLDSFETIKRVPTGRIIGAAQVGVILASLGFGLLILSLFYRFEQPVMPIMGAIVLSLGIGFLFSSFVAHRLMRSMAREDRGDDLLRSDVA